MGDVRRWNPERPWATQCFHPPSNQELIDLLACDAQHGDPTAAIRRGFDWAEAAVKSYSNPPPFARPADWPPDGRSWPKPSGDPSFHWLITLARWKEVRALLLGFLLARHRPAFKAVEDRSGVITDRDGNEWDSRAEMRISSLSDGLGWCGCGENDATRDLVIQYLAAVDIPDELGSREERQAAWARSCEALEAMDRGAKLILMQVCDAVGWTEHGSSVNGAWLTEAGRAALADLRARSES